MIVIDYKAVAAKMLGCETKELPPELVSALNRVHDLICQCPNENPKLEGVVVEGLTSRQAIALIVTEYMGGIGRVKKT